MHILSKMIRLGVNDKLTLEEIKRVIIFNTMIYIGMLVVVTCLGYAILFQLSLEFIAIFLAIFISLFIPLLLNIFGYHTISKIYFILDANCSLILLSILFGSTFHFQYFLMVVIGMPIAFLKNDIGNYKYLLSAFTAISWIFLEYYFIQHTTFFEIETGHIHTIRMVNNILVLTALFTMFFMFDKQGDHHILEIEQQKDRLEKMEQFTHTVTHDLRSPLSSISALMGYIKKDYEKDFDDELKEMFELIKSGTDHLNELVSSILSYTKVGNGQIELSTFDVKDVIEHIISLLNKPNHIKLIVPHKSLVIRGAKGQFEQVLANLLSNAIKYNDKAEGEVEINYSVLDNKYVLCKIRDNGIGIKQRYLNKVFDIFVTAHGVKRDDSTGVGLAIVKKLIELNQGKIGVKSIEGKGSIFWFTWPLSTALSEKEMKQSLYN